MLDIIFGIWIGGLVVLLHQELIAVNCEGQEKENYNLTFILISLTWPFFIAKDLIHIIVDHNGY